MLHSHRLTPSQTRNDGRQLLRTQHPVPILVQLIEASQSAVHKFLAVEHIREVSWQVPHDTLHCLPVHQQHVNGVADGSHTWILDLLRLQPPCQHNELRKLDEISNCEMLPSRIEHLNEPLAMVQRYVHRVLRCQLHDGRHQLIRSQSSAAVLVQITEHTLTLGLEGIAGERGQQPLRNHVGVLLENVERLAGVRSEFAQHLIDSVPRSIDLLPFPRSLLVLEPGHGQAKLNHVHILLLRNDTVMRGVKHSAELFTMIQRDAHGTARPGELHNHWDQLLQCQHPIPIVV
mmetsp:Transcript_94003/g.215074  ORF Transcript_94003/g.215074 Transcript_94003/m.215074 type:complete len:289 (-) Transcript_94003:1610-2476(-)